MADQKIELEIVLDDGSIKKAFGTIRKEAEDTGKKATDSFSGFLPVAILNQGLELFDKIASGVKKAANEMINLSLEAEKVRVVNAQFLSLTQQNSIATESFNAAIQDSIKGLMDDEDALQIANQAMIRLGATAQRLPEIFELSRKAAAAGFGDMASNAEAFTNAIQTGQTRQLRSLGIIADVTKAQNEFAKSIGLTASQLTEEQKAFVNSNVILDAASKKFKNTDADIKSFSDSLQRFKVASADSFERFAIAFDKAFGPSVKGIIDSLTIALNGNGSALKAAAVPVQNLTKEIGMMELKLERAQQRFNSATTETSITVYSNQVKILTADLEELKKRQEASKLVENDILKDRIEGYSKWKVAADARALTEEQERQRQEAALARQQQYSQAQIGFEQQALAARQNRVQFITEADAREFEQQSIYNEQLRLLEEQHQQSLKDIDVRFSNEKGYAEEERKALKLQSDAAFAEQERGIQEANQQRLKDSFTKYGESQAKTWKEMAAMAKITLVNGIGSSFAAFGQALAKGEDAMAAFGKALLGVLGDIAIQMGQMFIWQGLGFSANPLMPGAGAGMVAAGIGLSILGGVLKGLAGGGGGSTSNASASAGGGLATGGDSMGTFSAAGPMATDSRVNPNTVINFTVQGDVLDSSDTQNRIVELLNSAIDTKGAVVRGL
ncbi:MAG: hypothetical protein IPQ08_05855 [Chitinophagaceae bacterium]|nr:hypothetical protein [Chitinophagaceae bacterium]